MPQAPNSRAADGAAGDQELARDAAEGGGRPGRQRRPSALVGSKYAAVVDGRLTAAALLEDCERITRYHTGLTQAAKEALLAALRACRQANRERNRVIHDTWATRPGSSMVTLHDERRSHHVLVTAHTLSEVRQLADQVADAADELRAAMTTALGGGWALVEDQLRQELGHEVRVDPAG